MNNDSTYLWVRALVWIVGVPIIIYLCTRIVARVRDIRKLDVKLRAEEQARLDAALRGDKPLNPYADMAALYGASAEAEEEAKEASDTEPVARQKPRKR